MEYRIELPWPDKHLWPNKKASTHWKKLGPIAKSAKTLAFYETKAAKISRLNWSHVDALFVFHPPTLRKYDDDGALGACKHYRDGIADAIGIDDALWRCTPRKGEKRAGGCVLVTLSTWGGDLVPYCGGDDLLI